MEADAPQLGQVVMNLVTNASEAIEARPGYEGRIAIRSGTLEADRKSLSRLFLGEDLSEGIYVYLEVEDNGCGMSEETKKRIFEPFFTTKRDYGTGLGLSITYGIIKKLGGDVTVDSTLGEGTTFTVYLPTRSAIGEPG